MRITDYRKKGIDVKKIIQTLLALILLVVLVVGGYVAYVFLSYHRIPDNQPVDIVAGAETNPEDAPKLGEEYKITCYNIGFGAYLPDYTFFMDGGTESRAKSRESVEYSTEGCISTIRNEAPDFAIFEEVDLDSDRSHHVNQHEMITEAFQDYWHTFAVNYDSAYLFYPVDKPIGKSKSGVSCFSRFPMMDGAVRRSFPIETGFNKFFDLDRCYSKQAIETESGNQLVIYALHMSAYSSDPAVRDGQMQMLTADMAEEYNKGNYVIAGGDYNHDMKAEGDTDLTMDWAHFIDRSTLPEGISVAFDFLKEEEKAAFPDTTRNTDIPYTPGVSFTVTIDGFLISDNIEMTGLWTVDPEFRYSDHNAVAMTFKLK